MKQLLLSILMMFPLATSAEIVEKNGLWYNLNSEDNTAEVVASQGAQYSGNISIPYRIYNNIYNNQSYKVTSIGESAFEGCTGLTSITIPTSVIIIEKGAFYGCIGLTSLKIPEGVTRIGMGAFSVCNNLTCIVIPSSVTNIESYAFDHCPSLNRIFVERDNPIDIDNTVFESFDDSYNVYTMATLVVPDGTKSAYQSATGWSNFSNISEVEKVKSIHVTKAGTLPDIIVSDMEKYYIEELTLTGEINGTDLGFLREMGGQEKIGIIDNTLVYTNTKINKALSLDISKINIVAGGDYYFLDTSGTTNSREWEYYYLKSNNTLPLNVFRGCNIKSIILPQNLKSISNFALSYTALTSISIPKSVTTISSIAFYGCTNLTSITVEDENNTYDSRKNCNAIINNNNQLIVGCKNTIIPNSVTSIGDYAFSGCKGLTSITIPNNVTSIGSSAFSGCTGLTSISFPNNVTSIGSSAFKGCTGLVYITLPSNLNSIGYYAFYGCNSLTDVYCKAETVPSADNDSFSNPGNISLRVPSGSETAYKSTEPWSKFKECYSLYNSVATEKCAKPTISIVDGKFVFSCETSGVSYRWGISTSNGNNGYGVPTLPITLNVFATKSGYLNSDVATYEFNGLVGDVDGNGVVDVADHVKLSSIIMEQSE